VLVLAGQGVAVKQAIRVSPEWEVGAHSLALRARAARRAT
jgi:hypothetical protein